MPSLGAQPSWLPLPLPALPPAARISRALPPYPTPQGCAAFADALKSPGEDDAELLSAVSVLAVEIGVKALKINDSGVKVEAARLLANATVDSDDKAGPRAARLRLRRRPPPGAPPTSRLRGAALRPCGCRSGARRSPSPSLPAGGGVRARAGASPGGCPRQLRVGGPAGGGPTSLDQKPTQPT